MLNSKIEWCDHTVNLWWGCTEVHEGCDNCYAKNLAKRYGQELNDIQEWLKITEWNSGKPITKNLITRIQNKMIAFNVINEKKNSELFIKNMYI